MNCWNIQNPALKKTCSNLFHENEPKYRLKNLQKFKPMTENFQDKLHQVDCKQSKGAKISGVIRRELECEKCSKTFCQIYAIQNMQNQTNAKHFIDSEDVFKSTKNVLEKRSTNEDPSNITTCKVLSKIWNRKNLHSNNTTFRWLKVLLKFMVHSVELNS